MAHEIWPKFSGLDCLSPLPHQPPGFPGITQKIEKFWFSSQKWANFGQNFPKIRRGGQTVRFTGVILKRKFNFQDVLPSRKVSHPQSRQLFYCKMWPEHGARRVDTSEKHKKSPVAAKRCVLQRWHWSAKLIFRTFHLLGRCLALILDYFYWQMRPEHWVRCIKRNVCVECNAMRHTQCSGLIWK